MNVPKYPVPAARFATPAGVDALDLVDPARFAAHGYPHETWRRLRAEAPIAYIVSDDYDPFWAVTKHADIVAIATQPERFASGAGVTLHKAGYPPMPPVEMIVMMDPPQHGPMRRLVQRRFTSREVRTRAADIERIAADVLDTALPAGGSGECDFIEAVAAPFPLAVMAWHLGLPREDWPFLYRCTNEIIGNSDPEFRIEGESPAKTFRRARGEMHAYLEAFIAERRAEPRDDLVSELIVGEVEGKPLTAEQLLLYCEVLVEAGNETTRNAIGGGLLAFGQHPDQWERLRAHPELLPEAVDEILRWVSPITHFARTATEDCEVGGQPIRAGEMLALYFASANRDEDVFDDPFTFRIDRKPNPHLAFGIGEHFCVGAQLARLELSIVFRRLLERVDHFELAGPVSRLESIINGSIKHLPIRYEIREAAQ